MSDLTDLYQSVILDHNRKPRNFGEMGGADRTAQGRNPLCGDEMTLWLKLDGDVISDVSFVGAGCAISKASASIMTTLVKGKTRTQATQLFDRFHGLVTGQPGSDAPATDDAAARRMEVFSGVSRFPIRVKCAILAWHALRAALAESPSSGEGVEATPAAV
jgi:nitrogen fixation protein NifU and related proteins